MIQVISKQLEEQIKKDESRHEELSRRLEKAQDQESKGKKATDMLNEKELEELKEISKRLIHYYNRCRKCGSLMTYIRIKDNERVCRNCGYVGVLE